MESISFEARMSVQDTSKIQLYSAFTPNGIKVSAALEEIKDLRKLKEDFDYEPHVIDIRHGESRSRNFRSINPNGKIPLIIDPTGDDEVVLSESGAILIYLAEKYDSLLPKSGSERYVTLQWLFWSSSAFSVQTKLFGFYYKYCLKNLPYCLERYTAEVKRLLAVLEFQLQGKTWVAGEQFTIADISIWPWVWALYNTYDNCVETIFNKFKEYPNVVQWYNKCIERPSSQASLQCVRFMA